MAPVTVPSTLKSPDKFFILKFGVLKSTLSFVFTLNLFKLLKVRLLFAPDKVLFPSSVPSIV